MGFRPFTVQGWSDISGSGGPVRGDDPAVGQLAVQHLAVLHPDVRFGDGTISRAVNGCGLEGQWLRQFGGMGRGLSAFT